MSISLAAENVDGVIILKAAGELGADSVTKLQEAVRLMAGNGSLRCVVDLTAVAFADGPGYVGLLTANRILREAGGVLAIASMNRQVYETLTRAGARENLKMFTDTPNAVETLRDTPLLGPDDAMGEKCSGTGRTSDRVVNVKQVLKTYHDLAGPDVNAPEPPGTFRVWIQAVEASGVTFNATALLIGMGLGIFAIAKLVGAAGSGWTYWLIAVGFLGVSSIPIFRPELSKTFLAVAAVASMGILMVAADAKVPSGTIPLIPSGTLLKYSVLGVLAFCALDAASSRIPIATKAAFCVLAFYSAFSLMALPYHTLAAAVKAKILPNPSLFEPIYTLLLITFPLYMGWTIFRMMIHARKGGSNPSMPLLGLMSGFAAAGLAWVACVAAL